MPLLPPPYIHEICITDHAIDHQAVALNHLSTMTDEELDSNLKLDEFFGSLYVINLPKAQDRLERITRDLHSVGVHHFQVWRATNGRNPEELSESIWSKMTLNWRQIDISTPEGLQNLQRQFQGEAGCFMSHYRLLLDVQNRFKKACKDLQKAVEQKDKKKKALAARRVRKYSSVLVMEDDNGFGFVNRDYKTVSLQGVGRHLREAMAQLPKDWDMLYFMAQSSRYAPPISSNLKQLAWGTVMNAYVVSYRMYDAVIEHLKNIEDPAVTSLTPVDNEIAMLHANHRCYAIFPSIAYQCEGISQIVGWSTDFLRQLQP